MLDDFFTDSFMPRRSLTRDTFKVDVQENEKEYIVEAELPGIEKGDIKLELNEGRLNISVEREEKKVRKKRKTIFTRKDVIHQCVVAYIYKMWKVKMLLQN